MSEQTPNRPLLGNLRTFNFEILLQIIIIVYLIGLMFLPMKVLIPRMRVDGMDG